MTIGRGVGRADGRGSDGSSTKLEARSCTTAGSRRPLSSEDFEEELDIPEFLRSQ